jgi:hypothetical protein
MILTDHAGVRLTHGKPTVNGVEIHYAVGGAGEPVFLLHGWHFSFFSLPNLPELLLAGRERPFWTYFARRQMWDPSALTEDDIDEMVHSAEQPGGTRAILEMYRARQTDAEQNRPHYADPISCPVLAVGAQASAGACGCAQISWRGALGGLIRLPFRRDVLPARRPGTAAAD